MSTSLLWIPPDDTRYVYGVSLVRAMEWSLLTRKTLEAMARADDPMEALEELGETSYAAHMSPGQRALDFEVILDRVLQETYGLFRRLVLSKSLERHMLRIHDLHNLKALVKAKLNGTEPGGVVPHGLVDVEILQGAIESGEYHELPPELGLLAHQVLAAYELSRDPRLLEVVIDTAAVSSRVNALAALNTPVLPEYSVMLADTTNLRTVVRMSRSAPDPALLELAYIPGGSVPLESVRSAVGKGVAALPEVYGPTPYAKAVREGLAYLEEKKSYSVLDRELENLLVAKLRETRFVFFSPAPLVSFMLAREHEVGLVRLIMVAKINRIPTDRIVGRLPMLYG